MGGAWGLGAARHCPCAWHVRAMALGASRCAHRPVRGAEGSALRAIAGILGGCGRLGPCFACLSLLMLCPEGLEI